MLIYNKSLPVNLQLLRRLELYLQGEDAQCQRAKSILQERIDLLARDGQQATFASGTKSALFTGGFPDDMQTVSVKPTRDLLAANPF